MSYLEHYKTEFETILNKITQSLNEHGPKFYNDFLNENGFNYEIIELKELYAFCEKIQTKLTYDLHEIRRNDELFELELSGKLHIGI